jgi:Transposase DDE domain
LIIFGTRGILIGKEAAMFLRRYTRSVAGKKMTYYALVESVRTPHGPRQRIVAHLGELNHDQQRRWQRTVVFHNRQGEAQQLRLFPEDADPALDDDPDVVRIRLSKVAWTNARNFGDIYLARWLWRYVQLDAIVDRHLPLGKHTVRPADIVAIEVINRLCAPCSEFALAEHWYAATGLEDLLGIADADITKDRLYRTLDGLRLAKVAIEQDLQQHLATLFDLDYELLLYDLTSTYFEGLADDNPLAQRGYSRDRRSDCKQIVIALVVTRDGFPLAHECLVGNTQDGQTVQTLVRSLEQRFGTCRRVWVMDRGMVSKENLAFLSRAGRRYLIALKRGALTKFAKDLTRPGWQRLPDNEEVEVKALRRGRSTYLLARSLPRRRKERAIRRRQLLKMHRGLRSLQRRIAAGRLKKRDKILEALGRLNGACPKATPLVQIATLPEVPTTLTWSWRIRRIKAVLLRDGAYVLRTNQPGWQPQELWQTYMQLTLVEKAFRVLKSELLLRPLWHHYSGRVEAHVFICVLAYTLWKALDHLLKRAGLQTEIRKASEDEMQGSPQPRPMTPQAALRELHQVHIGDILLETTEGQTLALRRVARPEATQAKILRALGLELPERLSTDRLL